MNVAGIDVSKGKSTVFILRPLGEVVAKPFEVPHASSKLEDSVKHLKSLEGETKAVMEHTGRHHKPIVWSLSRAGIFVSAVNPKRIKDHGNNSLRKVKTDKADVKKIAKDVLDNQAELRQYIPMDKTRYQLKTLNRQCSKLTSIRTALKNSLIAALDQTYPGSNEPFTSAVREDGTQKWVDFVKTFWHLDCIQGISLVTLTERYQKWYRRNKYNFSSNRAAQIYADAQDRIALLTKDSLTAEANRFLLIYYGRVREYLDFWEQQPAADSNQNA